MLIPAAAQASRNQESLFQDDYNLLRKGEDRRTKTLDEMRSLGADVVRLNVIWSDYAPKPRAKKKPSFNAADPNAYPGLATVDAVVNGAQSRGMSVLLTPTVPGPGWASRCKGSYEKRRICRPKADQYRMFVKALGARYPSVVRWSFMNEPNQGGWLTPQSVRRGGTVVRESAKIYRGLVRAGSQGLAASGHADDQMLLGETAPIGRTSGSLRTRTTAPVDFYRELFCLGGRGGRLSGKAAKIRGCKSYKRLPVTGVAHHPYTSGAGQDPYSRAGRDDITIGSIGRLALWLDRAASRGRISRGLPIHYTEYGVQTNPPDRFAGTSLRNQAKWINQSDYISWRNGRVRTVAQYELRDERDPRAFQTGLRFRSGKAKPALAAYRLPIWVTRRGSSTRIWLQVRPMSRLGGTQQVTIQYKKKGAKKFTNLRTVNVSDAHGFKRVSTKKSARQWRVAWNGHKSRKAAPAKR
jgi:hypothetical protein